MPSHVDFIFWSFFDGFLLPTSTPRTSRIKPPLQREHDLSKNRFSHFALIFHQFWCQHASIFVPKIHQNRFKNQSWKALVFDRFLHLLFIEFCSIWEANLEPTWPHFPSKRGECAKFYSPFCWVDVTFQLFGRPGSLLAPIGLDFKRLWARFWKVWGSILEASGDYLATFRCLFSLQFSSC